MTHPFTPDTVRSCSRKLRYATKHIAHQVAKKARKKSGQEIREYRCDFCGGFHIGHVPASKRKEAS